jgi:hypothetical protein
MDSNTLVTMPSMGRKKYSRQRADHIDGNAP